MKTENKPIRQAVILAAGERQDFDKPATFLEIGETTIIARLISILIAKGIEKIILVVGYKNHYFDNLDVEEVKLVYSDRYKWTGTMHSLSLVEKYIDEDFLLIEGDLIFEERALDYLLEAKDGNCLVITNESGSGDEGLVESRNGSIFKISKDMHQISSIDGEFIGLSKITVGTYRDMIMDFKYSKNPYLHYEYVLINIKDKHTIGYTKIDDLVWAELDTEKDYNNLKIYIYPELKKREVEFREKYIKDLFLEIMGDGYQILGSIEKLGGMNNNNYKIYRDKTDFVFRLPGKGSNESVNRDSELFNAKVAYKIGIDCKTIYFDNESGLKITEYIHKAETLNLETARKENNMELMAYTLSILHDSKEKFYRDFKPFIEIEEYKETIKEQEESLLEKYKETIKEQEESLLEKYKELNTIIEVLSHKINNLQIAYVPCHLDAWPENFVKGMDKMYLIDWEYSANYDRLWDVVSISLECDYSPDEEELFFKKYFNGRPREEQLEKMNILRILMDIYWSMWSLAKVACGERDLYDYSFNRYKRGLDNFNNIII